MEKRPEYSYSKHPDIITQSELGRITGVNGPTKGKLLKANGRFQKSSYDPMCRFKR